MNSSQHIPMHRPGRAMLTGLALIVTLTAWLTRPPQGWAATLRKLPGKALWEVSLDEWKGGVLKTPQVDTAAPLGKAIEVKYKQAVTGCFVPKKPSEGLPTPGRYRAMVYFQPRRAIGLTIYVAIHCTKKKGAFRTESAATQVIYNLLPERPVYLGMPVE